MKLLFIPIFSCFAGTLVAAERMALVIGNGGYPIAKLENPASDAKLIGDALTVSGFAVTRETDLSLDGMRKAIETFQGKARDERASAVLVYYAGHGIELKGQNYLVPVDADVKEEYQVASRTLPLGEMLGALDNTQAALKIVIMDCCRDNPLGRSFKRTSAGSGLAAVTDTPEGTILAYATSPGKTAADGQAGANSPFAAALGKSLAGQGLTVEEVFKAAIGEVKKVTNREQQPWLSLNYEGRFVFNPGTPGEASATPPDPLMTPPVIPLEEPAAGLVKLPASGFFTLDQIYEDTAYATYNDYTKRQILRRVQEKLVALKYYDGEIDGSMGPLTQQAILGWQKKAGEETGKIDARTQSGLGVSGIMESMEPPRKVAANKPPSHSKTQDRSASPKPTTQARDYPYARAVPGKTGFVISPYNNKFVDVRDIPRGTLVQDPGMSTPSYFRVP